MARDNLAVSGSFSMSPLYVLITICDSKLGHDRIVAVTANFLSGAIDVEYHLRSDTAGWREEFEIAMRQPSRRFCFRSREARARVEVDYTPETLAEVRRRLAHLSGAQLRAELSRQGWVGSVRWWHTPKYQDAVAHVLLERGILVGEADYTHALYLDDKT